MASNQINMDTDCQPFFLHDLPDEFIKIIPELMLQTIHPRQPLSSNDVLKLISYSMYAKTECRLWT